MKKYKKFEGHTPGPWSETDRTHYENDYPTHIGYYVNISGALLFIGSDQEFSKLSEFNATRNLIAAAPDLLKENKALREFVERCKQRGYGVEAATVARYLLAELDKGE